VNIRMIKKRDGMNWRRVRMYDLQPGDVFRFSNENAMWIASSEPHVQNGVWSIQANPINFN
jgi:hypothetical protein